MPLGNNSKDYIFDPFNLDAKLYDFLNKTRDVFKFYEPLKGIPNGKIEDDIVASTIKKWNSDTFSFRKVGQL